MIDPRDCTKVVKTAIIITGTRINPGRLTGICRRMVGRSKTCNMRIITNRSLHIVVRADPVQTTGLRETFTSGPTTFTGTIREISG
jgi:hypothetical protein